MKHFKSVLCGGLLFAGIFASAQQDPNYTLYRYNMNLVNPAYAGAHEGSELGLNLRSQWAGVTGAPETQSVFFGAPVGRNVGLGVSIINDRTFVENQTSVSVDVSYRVKVSDEANLYFGIKAGANSYNINTDGLVTFGVSADPLLTDLDGKFTPNVGAGAYLKGSKYFVSVSIPRILTPDRVEADNGLISLGRNRIHSYLAAGYDFDLSDNFIFKPSAQLRYIDSAPLTVDMTAAFQFNQRFEFGATYRLQEGLGGLLIVTAADWVDLGYVYENSTQNPIAAGSGGTHEVYIKLRI